MYQTNNDDKSKMWLLNSPLKGHKEERKCRENLHDHVCKEERKNVYEVWQNKANFILIILKM
jgi:hypothetical protein